MEQEEDCGNLKISRFSGRFPVGRYSFSAADACGKRRARRTRRRARFSGGSVHVFFHSPERRTAGSPPFFRPRTLKSHAVLYNAAESGYNNGAIICLDEECPGNADAQRAGVWCKSGRKHPRGIASEQRTERHPISRLRRDRPLQRDKWAYIRIYVNLGGTAKIFVPLPWERGLFFYPDDDFGGI